MSRDGGASTWTHEEPCMQLHNLVLGMFYLIVDTQD
jgi:hypothetical protein